MFLHNILLSILFTVKGHDNLLNISIGILNAQTVIACQTSMNIYFSFIPSQILRCPHVIIQEDIMQSIHIKIPIQDEEELNQLIIPPKPMIKLINNSFIYSSNFTRFSTYYLSFSTELMCRYSFLKNITICFYYPSSINFSDIEHHFDKITNVTLVLPIQTHKRFIIIFILIGILVIIICFLALYILCTSRLHRIQLDYIIDPQLARQAALKLAPEPV